MRYMTRVRAALVVVLICLSVAGLVFGQDSDPCYQAYLGTCLTAQQMTYNEFQVAYGDTVCATDVASLSQNR